MWHIYSQIAIDLARERTREAAEESAARRARAEMEAEARARGTARPSRIRAAAAAGLRAVSGLLGSVSRAACEAATRVERQTA